MATNLDIQKMYIAYFGRPADVMGLQYWEAQITAANGSPSAVINAFSASAEYANAYAGQSSAFIVNSLYNNLFGRDAELDGLTYWSTRLDNGTFNVGNVAWAIMTGAQNTDVTALSNKTTAAQAFTDAMDTTAEILGYSGTAAVSSAKTWLSTVTDSQATLTAAQASVGTAVSDSVTAGTASQGQVYTLTTGVDSGAAFTGTANDDTFVAAYDITAAVNTLGGLDVLDGGAGTDTLSLTSASGAAYKMSTTAQISNIESMTIRGDNTVTADVSGTNVTGLGSIAVTTSTAATVTAATTTDVSVSGSTGAIIVDGGKNVTVSDATATTAITIGGGAVNAGTITVTDTNQSTGNIAIDGGTTVDLTTSGRTTGTIKVGDTGAANVATDMASGAITVIANEALASAGTAAAITVEGGSSISITENITASAAAITTASTSGAPGVITGAAIAATGGAATTSITVNQTAAKAAVAAVTAATAVAATTTATFTAVTSGTAVTVNGLTFTAGKDLTAAEVAAAFSGLTAGDKQAGTGPTANGVYTGTSAAAWTTGAVTTVDATHSSVTFTAVNGTAAVTAATNATLAVVSTGTAGATGVTGVLGVVNGGVTVDGNITGTDVLSTVSLNAYGTSTIASDALTSLTLANSAAGVTVTNTAATTLALNLDNLTTGSTVATGATYTTLNITTAGTDSDVTLTAAGVETLTVAGSKAVDLTGATLTALETVTVSGSAGLTIDASGANVTAVNTTATTGTVTATVNADLATYTGGAGVDAVTLSSTTVDKAVNLGAGNDSLTLATGTTALTSEMIAGDGTDTLVMVAADAVTASATTTFETKITSFEKLSLGAAAAVGTVNLANMDDISYVVSANSTGGAIAEVQTFTVTAGTGAAVPEQQTINFDTNTVTTTAGTIIVGGITVTLLGTENQTQIAAAVAAAINGQILTSPATTTTAVTATSALGVVTITYPATANFGAVTVVDGTAVSSGAAVIADNAVAYDSNAGNITIEGVAVAVTAGLTADQVGALIAAANYSATTINTVAYNAATDTVTVTYDAGVDEGNTTTVDTDSTGVTFGAVATTTTGAATGGTSPALTISNMANNGTLELTDAGSGAIVTMTDATSTTADSFNIVTKVNAADLIFGTVDVAGVETVNITATDITPVNTTTGAATISEATMTLSDAAVKSVVIDGNSDLVLTAAGASLTSVNASALTGNLTFSSAVNSATITGGAGDDHLTAAGSAQTLIAGAGNDTLVAGTLATLTGGAGNDTFDMTTQLSNVNSYSTITDLSAGDVILTNSTVFKATAVTLASTAVFQDYANEAIKTSAATDVTWFQFQGNTYVVENDSSATSFTNGTDDIIKITGLVDLSHASFNATSHTIEIA